MQTQKVESIGGKPFDFTKWLSVARLADSLVSRLVADGYDWRPSTVESAVDGLQAVYNQPSPLWSGTISDDELPLVRRLVLRAAVEHGVQA